MRNKINLIILFLFNASIVIAQNPNFPNKHDAVWLSGYANESTSNILGGMRMDFNNFPPTIEIEDRDMDFKTSIGVTCDNEGLLQCYSNGAEIANYTDNIMENGTDLNPDISVDQTLGYQEFVSIPIPDSPNMYYFFHKEEKWVVDGEGNDMDGFWTANIKTYYSTVDMSFNGGLGKVVEKNVELVNDTLNFGLLTAVKHGNGRDWWVILPEYWSNNYYRFLITPNGIENKEQQIVEAGEGLLPALGQAVFSPDGSKYIVTGSKSNPSSIHLDIYDFDRCEGLLSNHRRKVFPNNSFGKPVVVSPNSRYLYLYVNQFYYQYDLWADDIFESEVLLAEYDGFQAPFHTPPFLAQIGLDGKIYYSTTSTTFAMHVIHDPDFSEEEAKLEQHSIILPKLNYGTIANHPNYRLGPIDGSSCDTLGIDNLPIANFRHETFTDTVHFRDLSAGEPTDWYWTLGDGENSSEKHNNHIYDSGGLYEVCLTVSNQNGSDTWCDSVQILTTSAVEQQELSIESSIFPNPSDGLVLLQTEQNLPPDSYFKVYDQAGRLVFDKELQSGFDKQNIELYDLSNGMYFYEILLSDFVIGKGKLVISR